MIKNIFYEVDMNREQIVAETVRKVQEGVAMHFGTYTDKDEVKVLDVVRLINQITEEILEEGE